VSTTDEGLVDVPDVLALKAAFLSQHPSKAPGWSELLATNSPSVARLPVPGLVVQGLTDTRVRPDVTEAWVAAQCAAGADLQLNTYSVEEFETEAAAFLRAAQHPTLGRGYLQTGHFAAGVNTPANCMSIATSPNCKAGTGLM